jgi:hypothetical protein
MAADKRKFAALAELGRQSQQSAEVYAVSEPPASAAAPDSEPAIRGRGRPATGKRSNPEYKLYAYYLRKRTHRQVTAKLAALHAEDDHQPDLSELMQELLEAWLARQNA